MRLTLDHDSEQIHELHYPGVKDRVIGEHSQATLAGFLGADDPTDFTGKYERWQSSGGEGYHYIEAELPPDRQLNQQLRQDFGDDQLRISLDAERAAIGSPFYQVLYHLKGVRPGELPPYRTGERARLLERQGFGSSYDFDGEEGIVIWDGEGNYRIDYRALAERLAEHPDFGSRAAVWRAVSDRSSVEITTEPRKRGYDIARGRREPQPSEKKALRDYAMSRDIGHYQDGEATTPGTPPDAPPELPRRTTFHEYFSVPDLTDDQGRAFGVDEGESDWYPANLRVGHYDQEIPEGELKQLHDRVAVQVVDILSPPGIDLGRITDAISLERGRWLDRDEVAVYRAMFRNNQPEQIGDPYHRADPVDVGELIDRGRDPFGMVLWECIVYQEEYQTPPWYVVRGVLPVEHIGTRDPLGDSYIVADTRGFAIMNHGAQP